MKNRIRLSENAVQTCAGIVVVLSALIILLDAYCVTDIIDSKITSLFFFACDFFMLVRYKLYKSKTILWILAFLIWAGSTATFAGAELTKAWGGQVMRGWYFCLFAFLTMYIMDAEKRRKLLVSLLLITASFADVLYILILRRAYCGLFDASVETNTVKGILYNGRLHAFGNANFIGPIAAVTMLTGIMSVLIGTDTEKRDKRHRVVFFSVGIVTFLTSLLIMTLCRSRGAILAVTVGTFFLILRYCLNRLNKTKAVSVLWAVITAAVVLLLCGCTKSLCDFVVNTIAERTQTPEKAQEIAQALVPYSYDYALNTLSDRTLIWSATIRMMKESPTYLLTGVTTSKATATAINYVYEGRPEMYADFAHNGYLQALLIYGIPGALILFVILLKFCVCGVKAYFRKGDSAELAKEHFLWPFMVMAVLMGMVENYPFPTNNTVWLLSYIFFLGAGYCYGFVAKKEAEGRECARENRWKKAFGIALLAVFLISVITPVLTSQIMKAQKNKVANHTEIAENATEAMQLMESSVDERMLSADYWIANASSRNSNPEQVLMTAEEIADFNQKNRKRLSSRYGSFALTDVGEKFNGKVLLRFIADSAGDFEEGGKYCDKVGNIEELWQYRNLEAIGPNVPVSFGYAIERTTLRRLPGASSPVYAEEGIGQDYDEMAVAELMPLAKLVVLHMTEDDEWAYVLTEDCGGWVPCAYLAVCDSKEEWLSTENEQTENGFVMVLAKSVKLAEVDLEIPMGTKIVATPVTVDGAVSAYILKLPVSEDGRLHYREVLVPAGDDFIYNAYLPYTQENLLRQVFKFLGEEYGWAGSNNSVDCSLLMQQVYATFGIRLPRNSLAQSTVEGAETIDFFFGTAQKRKLLTDMPAGSLLYFPGHIMMYLGTVDGVPYCISSVATLETVDMAIGERLVVNRVLVSNMDYTTRASGVSWLNSVERITVLK